MLNFRQSLLAATMLLTMPALAHAQPIEGVYLGAGAGFNFLQDEHIKASSLPPPVGSVKTSYQPGWAGVGSIGYGFGNGVRVELEGNYRTNHLRNNPPVGNSNSANEVKYGAMFNVLYDFDLNSYGVNGYGVVPYLGVGAGWVHNTWRGITIADGTGRVKINNGMDDVMFQGIVGAAFPVTGVPGLAITAEYRLVDQPGNRNYASLYTNNGTASTFKSHVNGDLNHSVLLGVRYALYTPPPAAAAAAPVMSAVNTVQPAPSRSYLVFFDWDRADLSARATQIISDAAQNATKVHYTRLDVQGHADLTGTHAYNQGLSLRRANAVGQQLVRDGVPENAIVITALGDTQPLVPTAAGVREPQNRRVEIVIR